MFPRLIWGPSNSEGDPRLGKASQGSGGGDPKAGRADGLISFPALHWHAIAEGRQRAGLNEGLMLID